MNLGKMRKVFQVSPAAMARILFAMMSGISFQTLMIYLSPIIVLYLHFPLTGMRVSFREA
jgi:hypothetical protein